MGDQTVFFTIASQNYVPQVRCLFESLRQYHPDARHLLCLVEEDKDESVFTDLEAEVVLAKDILGDAFLDLAYNYSITELNTAVKPFVMTSLLDEGAQRVVYIDPDCYLFSPLVEVEALLEGEDSILLTPHATHPIGDQGKPNEKDFLRAGTFNLGFVAVRAGAETRRFLSWWSERLSQHCIFDPLSGLFVDQKWVDLAPSFFDGVHVLRHPGYNVAYWNAFQRKIERRPGGWHVDGEPLRFFHFSGLPVDDVAQISRHQDRAMGDALGAFVAEFHTYLGRLASNALKPSQERVYSYTLHWQGEPIDCQALRTALRRHPRATPVKDLAAFRDEEPIAALLEPHPELPAHEMFPISRLMYDALLDRPVIARHYPLFTAAGRAQFLNWLLVEGFVSLEIDSRLLPWKELTTPIDGALGGRFAVPPLIWLLWLGDASLRSDTSFDSEKGYANLLVRLRKQIFDGARPEWQFPEHYARHVVIAGPEPITVAQYAVWLSRSDLQDAFDLDSAEGRAALRSWCAGPSPVDELPHMAAIIGGSVVERDAA